MRRGIALVFGLALMGCWGGPPDTIGARGGDLAPCPGTPNCVHTGLRYPQGTRGIYLAGRMSIEVMDSLVAVVESMPRTKVVERTELYLHAEATSAVFRFVDDLELFVAPDRELIVRSASRIGRSDMGVNAERVEELRRLLGEAELIR